jgi:hypothetical protein
MNEQVQRVQNGWPTTAYDLICECGDVDCLRVLTLDRQTYDRIAREPLQFVVLPGHERPEFEEIVQRQSTFVVVRPRHLSAAAERGTP